jgi:hypothetical protein
MSYCIPNSELTLIPVERGRVSGAIEGMSVGVFRLPTDPLKYVTLTFDGVNANSEIRIYRNSDNSETAGVELCDANHVFAGVPYYGTGQVCTVRIVHPEYKIKEFTYTIPGVDQTIPVQQELDRWYSNPI